METVNQELTDWKHVGKNSPSCFDQYMLYDLWDHLVTNERDKLKQESTNILGMHSRAAIHAFFMLDPSL